MVKEILKIVVVVLITMAIVKFAKSKVDMLNQIF